MLSQEEFAMTVNDPHPELSRQLRREDIPADGMSIDVEATPSECAGLARRFDVLSLDRLHAVLTLKRAAGGRVRADGRLQASGTQACVVTLEPVGFEIGEPLSLLFAPVAEGVEAGPPADTRAEFDPESDEVEDPIMDGVFDLGEAIAQHFAQLLEPYPRSPQAERDASPELADSAAEQRESPFAKLARLKLAKDG